MLQYVGRGSPSHRHSPRLLGRSGRIRTYVCTFGRFRDYVRYVHARLETDRRRSVVFTESPEVVKRTNVLAFPTSHFTSNFPRVLSFLETRQTRNLPSAPPSSALPSPPAAVICRLASPRFVSSRFKRPSLGETRLRKAPPSTEY